MPATQRDSFYSPDRTQSRFLPVKVFRPKRDDEDQEGDPLDSKLIGKSEVMRALKDCSEIDSEDPESFLRSIAREGDIVLPLELCVLRRDETFKQWTARAKHSSIEAVRQAT